MLKEFKGTPSVKCPTYLCSFLLIRLPPFQSTLAGVGRDPTPPAHSPPPTTIPAADVPTNKVVLWRPHQQPDKEERTQIVVVSPSWTINDFRSWLIAQGKTKATVKETVNYTKRFASVLDTGDASPILNMTIKPNVQHHALTALANLAKYTGRYQKFLEIRQRYNLKWSRGDPMTHFERFFNEELTLDVMLQRIKEMIEILPVQMGKIIKFGCLVGLRASEVIESVRLLNSENVKNHINGKNLQTQEISYYNPKRQALEHFRYKQFIRQTKKAYISFLTPEMLSIVQNLEDNVPTKNAITHACQRRHIPMDMYLTRKIFASWLRKEGIEPEVVDLLQGRVSQSVLTRHYLTPDSSLPTRVLGALNTLKKAIDQ